MSDQQKKTESIIPEFSRKMGVYFSFIYIAPVLGCLMILNFLRVFTVVDTLRICISPIFLATIIGFALYIIYIFKHYTKKIRSYDGTEKSMDVSNRAVKIFEIYSIGAAIANIFLFPFIITICGQNIGLDVNSFPVTTCYMGTVFSYSLFFYICFMQTLESEVKDLPYKEKYKSMSFIFRNIVVTTGGALGIIFYALTPIFVEALSGFSIMRLFWTYIFPCTVFGLIMLILIRVGL